jgi:ribosomal-protein-serine acetyltransferase
MFIHTIDEKTHMKILELADAAELFELTNNSRKHLKEWLPWLDFTQTEEDSKDFIKGTLQKYASGNGFSAGIWYEGKLAGTIGYQEMSKLHKSVSIGYWIGEGFQGKGLVTRACNALIHYAFNDMDLNRIEIRVATENHKSKAIAERLGFTCEGQIRKCEWLYDHYVDHYVYGLLKEDYRK